MQPSFNLQGGATLDGPESLMDLRKGEQGVLDRLELPQDIANRLMELGFLPGSCVTAAASAPGGDPRVFRVDGSEIALRRETAECLFLRNDPATGD
jgi:ferrous iron transport protein A